MNARIRENKSIGNQSNLVRLKDGVIVISNSSVPSRIITTGKGSNVFISRSASSKSLVVRIILLFTLTILSLYGINPAATAGEKGVLGANITMTCLVSSSTRVTTSGKLTTNPVFGFNRYRTK